MIRRNGATAKRDLRLGQSAVAAQYLFVYGTLKRNGESHGRLRGPDVQFVGPARLKGKLYALRGEEFPGAVVTTAPNRFVKGDLFALRDPQKILPDLDEYEGVEEGLFRRQLVNVWARGRRIRAWAYLYARPLTDANLIPTGIYSVK